MGRVIQRSTRRSTFRKSKMVRDSKGRYHCPTCGAFKGTGKKKR